MSIQESLQNAENEYSQYIRWGQVVMLLAQQNQVTEKEAARWLLLKNAHTYFDSYFLEAQIPRVTYQANDDKENKIEKILDSFIVNVHSPYNAIIGSLMGINLQDATKNSNCGVHLKLLNEFLTENGLPALRVQKDNAQTKIENEPKLTKPQQREIALLEYLKGDEGYANILTLPTTSKKEAREHLTKSQAKLFTDSTFNQAWGSLSARGDISLADKKKYLSN